MTSKQARIWKLSQADSQRITCTCGKPARYGHTANGGAPFFYDCWNCLSTENRILLTAQQISTKLRIAIHGLHCKGNDPQSPEHDANKQWLSQVSQTDASLIVPILEALVRAVRS